MKKIVEWIKSKLTEHIKIVMIVAIIILALNGVILYVMSQAPDVKQLNEKKIEAVYTETNQEISDEEFRKVILSDEALAYGNPIDNKAQDSTYNIYKLSEIKRLYMPIDLYPVTDIKDISKLKNLEWLFISGDNEYEFSTIRDTNKEMKVAPDNMEEIKNLSNLYHLSIVHIDCSNVDTSQIFSRCSSAWLSDSKIDTMKNLENAKNLESLGIVNCEVDSLVWIVNVKDLTLDYNQYTCDIELLSQITSETLEFGTDSKEEFYALGENDHVKYLSLYGDGVPTTGEDFTLLKKWDNLEELFINGDEIDLTTMTVIE